LFNAHPVHNNLTVNPCFLLWPVLQLSSISCYSFPLHFLLFVFLFIQLSLLNLFLYFLLFLALLILFSLLYLLFLCISFLSLFYSSSSLLPYCSLHFLILFLLVHPLNHLPLFFLLSFFLLFFSSHSFIFSSSASSSSPHLPPAANFLLLFLLPPQPPSLTLPSSSHLSNPIFPLPPHLSLFFSFSVQTCAIVRPEYGKFRYYFHISKS
jgi:hypothetical protein